MALCSESIATLKAKIRPTNENNALESAWKRLQESLAKEIQAIKEGT